MKIHNRRHFLSNAVKSCLSVILASSLLENCSKNDSSLKISKGKNIHWIIEEIDENPDFLYIKKIVKIFNLDSSKEVFPSYATKTTPNDSAIVEYKIRNRTLIQCTSFTKPIKISKNNCISKMNEINIVHAFETNNLKYFVKK